MPPRSMQARSVGNSAKLKATALVEAFNLRAAIELAMGSPAGGWGGCAAGMSRWASKLASGMHSSKWCKPSVLLASWPW